MVVQGERQSRHLLARFQVLADFRAGEFLALALDHRALVAGEPLPEGLSLGDECELKDAADKGAVVKCQRQELTGAEIGKHLESGKQVTRLALSLDDHVSFVLGEDLVLRKFRILDGAADTLESTEREDLRAELDARFTLMAGEFERLFSVLEPALKLSKV